MSAPYFPDEPLPEDVEDCVYVHCSYCGTQVLVDLPTAYGDSPVYCSDDCANDDAATYEPGRDAGV